MLAHFCHTEILRVPGLVFQDAVNVDIPGLRGLKKCAKTSIFLNYWRISLKKAAAKGNG